jgi:hypothetical protein
VGRLVRGTRYQRPVGLSPDAVAGRNRPRGAKMQQWCRYRERANTASRASPGRGIRASDHFARFGQGSVFLEGYSARMPQAQPRRRSSQGELQLQMVANP